VTVAAGGARWSQEDLFVRALRPLSFARFARGLTFGSTVRVASERKSYLLARVGTSYSGTQKNFATSLVNR
jgi:hypothetical protein